MASVLALAIVFIKAIQFEDNLQRQAVRSYIYMEFWIRGIRKRIQEKKILKIKKRFFLLRGANALSKGSVS